MKLAATTKTTFELEARMLVELKTTAARVGRTVRDLLTEGAQTVLEKYRRFENQAVLKRRSKEARLRMRAGFVASGPTDLADNHDRYLYGFGERAPTYSARATRKRRKK